MACVLAVDAAPNKDGSGAWYLQLARKGWEPVARRQVVDRAAGVLGTRP